MFMEYENNRPRPNLQDVSALGIKCAKCNADITELPFNPTKKEDGSFGTIYCYECNKERRRDFRRDR